MAGYIYCFSNDTRDDVFKIGMTRRDVNSRLAEANSKNTFSVPGSQEAKFTCKLSKHVKHPQVCEHYIHSKLRTYRFPKTEFFSAPLTEIEDLFNDDRLEEKAYRFHRNPLGFSIEERLVRADMDEIEYDIDVDTFFQKFVYKKNV